MVDLKTRAAVAWHQTDSFRVSRRQLAVAATVGGVAVVALLLFGSSSTAAADEIITVVAATIATYVLLPLAEFLWNFKRLRLRLIEEEVLALRADVEEFEAQLRPDSAVIRSALDSIMDDVRTSIRILEPAIREGVFWTLTTDAPRLKAWKKHRALFRGDAQYASIYECGQAAYEEVERVNQLRATRIFRRDRRVRSSDRLADELAALCALADEISSVSELVAVG